MMCYNEYYVGNYIAHFGTPRHSGRYPWGSGDRPYQSLETSRQKRKYAEKFRRTNSRNIRKNGLGYDVDEAMGGSVVAGIKNNLYAQGYKVDSANKKCKDLVEEYINSKDKSKYENIYIIQSSFDDSNKQTMSNFSKSLSDFMEDVTERDKLEGSMNLYLKDKNKIGEAVKAVNEYTKANNEYKESCKKAVDNILEVYGYTKMSNNPYSPTVAETLAKQIDNNFTINNWQQLELRFSIGDGKTTNEYGTSANKAKQISENFSDNVNFSNLSNAVSELGFDNINVDDMIDDQWKQLNNQLKSLSHSGIKGMKWGFSDGVRNGHRTAYEKESSANASSSTMTYSTNSKDKQKAKEQYESDIREIKNDTSEHDPIYYASHAIGASIKEGKDFIESLFKKK